VIATAHQYGWTGLLFKALDGGNWHASYASEQDAIGSVDDAAAMADRAHAAGLKFYVWTNPLSTHGIQTQGSLTGELALATDGVFMDFEPYAHFWGAWRPVGLARTLMERIREVAPDAFIAAQPDPRPARLAELRFEEIAPYVDCIAGQHYVSDFYLTPSRARYEAELHYAASIGERWGVPVWPSLAGNSDTKGWGLDTVPVEMLQEFGGLVVFRVGTTSPAMLELLGGIDMGDEEPEEPEQPEEPDVPDEELQQKYQAALGAIAHIADVHGDVYDQNADALRELAARLDQIGHGPEGDTIISVARLMDETQELADGIREQFVGPRPAATAARARAENEQTTPIGNGLVTEGADPGDKE
jgi:hypothetical protein